MAPSGVRSSSATPREQPGSRSRTWPTLNSNRGDTTGTAVAISSISAVAGAPAHDGAVVSICFQRRPRGIRSSGSRRPAPPLAITSGRRCSMTGPPCSPERLTMAARAARMSHRDVGRSVYAGVGTRAGRQLRLPPARGARGLRHGGLAITSAPRCRSRERLLLSGAPAHGGSGSAYVFSETGSTWSQVAELEAADPRDG